MQTLKNMLMLLSFSEAKISLQHQSGGQSVDINRY